MNNLLLKGKIFVLMLLTIGLTTACDDDDDDDNQTPLTVQTFMQQAAASDMFEINTGTMATNKGNRAEVKSFGQMLVTDHTMTSTALKTLASQKGVTLPTSLPQDKTEKVMQLQGLTGAAFDKQFSSMQVTAHQEAIALYEQADKDINDATVQTFIDMVLPKLRQHLTTAQSLENLTK